MPLSVVLGSGSSSVSNSLENRSDDCVRNKSINCSGTGGRQYFVLSMRTERQTERPEKLSGDLNFVEANFFLMLE